MSPLQLMILLHYRGSAEDFRDLHAPAIDEAMKLYENLGYLVPLEVLEVTKPHIVSEIKDRDGVICKWSMTEKGFCYVDAILREASKLPTPEYVCELVTTRPKGNSDA